MVALEGGFDFNDFYSTQYGDSLRRGSKTVQRANKYVSQSGDDQDPIGIHMKLSDLDSLAITQDNIAFNQTTAQFIFTDPNNNDELITDYTLKGVHFDMNMTT